MAMSNNLKSDGTIKAIYSFKEGARLVRPLVGTRVPAGFPSPATDYIEGSLDLTEHIIQHPASTFFMRVAGDSMIGAGIFAEDLLVVDRSLDATHNKIIVAIYDGELTLKRLRIDDEGYLLCAENPDYPSIRVDKELEFLVWGVVTFVIHRV